MSMKITQLYIHPIKSLLPIPVNSVKITPNGLQNDRTLMLIQVFPDGTIKHMTIKETSELCLFKSTLSVDGTTISVSFTPTPSATPIIIPLEPTLAPTTKSYKVDIFETSVIGHDMGPEAALFFSTHLGFPVILIHIGASQRGTHELLTPRPAPDPHPQGISFADAAPILITTKASLADVSLRHGEEFDVTKFRPNIFVETPDGTEAYDEEFWAEVEVGEDRVRLDTTFNTVRCQSINVDYETGKQMPPDRQIYKKLAKDRRINPLFRYKPCFGRYAFCRQFGAEIHVGDEIRVLKRNAERHMTV